MRPDARLARRNPGHPAQLAEAGVEQRQLSLARQSRAQAAALQAQIYHYPLAAGFSRGYLVSAGVLVLSLVIALFMMRANRADLSGAHPSAS